LSVTESALSVASVGVRDGRVVTGRWWP